VKLRGLEIPDTPETLEELRDLPKKEIIRGTTIGGSIAPLGRKT